VNARNPLFTALDELLDQDGTVSLGELLDAAGEQVYGLGVLLLALITFIPGVANFISVGTMILGAQMALGLVHPWIPKRVQTFEMRRGRIKEALAKLEERLAPLRLKRAPKRPVNPRWLGALVVWTAFLASLPIPLPFANVLPAAALVLLGMALLEEWPLLFWLGLSGSLGTTIYFALALREIIQWAVGLYHWILRLFGA
jgi:hypothetical protein